MTRAIAQVALLVVAIGGTACAESAEFPLRLDVVAGHSGLTKGGAPWTEADAALTYQPNTRTWLTASIEHSDRFGLSDTVVGLHAARLLSDGWSGGLGLALSPDAAFRARYQVQANVVTPTVTKIGAWMLAFGVDGTLSDYAVGRVKSLQPGVIFTSKGGSTFGVRLIETWDEFNKRRDGYALRAQAPLAKRVRVLAGYANAAESDLGVTVPTRAVNAGVMVDVGKTTTLRVDGVRENRPTFDRTEVTFAVTQLF